MYLVLCGLLCHILCPFFKCDCMPFLLVLICRSTLWIPTLIISQFNIYPKYFLLVCTLYFYVFVYVTGKFLVFIHIDLSVCSILTLAFGVLFRKPAIPQGQKYILQLPIIFF